MTLSQCLNRAKEQLDKAGVSDSSYDAFLLLEYVTGISRSKYLSCQNDDIDDEKLSKYERLVERRADKEPLQHIIGTACFFGYDYKVSPDVLVPRQETEILVERVLELASDYLSLDILDLCTGSGCIAVTLFLELTKAYENKESCDYDYGKCDITATDISDAALDIARENANRLIGDSSKIHFVKSDMFDSLDTNNRYDIIVSNPPYIPTSDINELEPEVKDFDPRIALDGGSDGLSCYRRIVGESVNYLRDSGYLFMEMGYNQGEEIAAIMRDSGYGDIRIYKDLAGKNRIIGGKKCLID